MTPPQLAPSAPVAQTAPGSPPRPSPVRLAAVWVLTRTLQVLLVSEVFGRVGDGINGEVHRIYRTWYEQLLTGAFPLDDVMWQYPPGAALVILSPALVPGLSYFQAFVALTLLVDAVVTAALVRAGRPQGRLAGAWVWVAGLPLLLHVPLVRYDVQVTALAVLSLLALRARPVLAGSLAAVGALVKVWPALALLGAPRGRTTKTAWGSAVVSAAALLGVLALAFSHTFDFLRQQGNRGVQIESLGGTVLALARLVGAPYEGAYRVEYRYGAMEYLGPYVSTVAHVSLALTVAAFGWLLLWRVKARRWTPATACDAALCAVLLFVVTSRVISPQYMIWLIGLSAVCMTLRESVLRPVVKLLLVASFVSTLAYPLAYGQVTSGTVYGCLLMLVRNGLLVAAAVLACRRLWASTVKQPRTVTQ
ncbi:membrane protein [Streptomyces spiroverticillatus]|uniref:Membrane protein n=1 Tax=Streptomyces finlayi TaxID=67296 RepID=A0A918WYL5_9ACTN|nr:glycosyltransferase family 87 protein [Streptomyces finlayi]GHA09658.1 membrane protein [Streptomyces spiroverticillatus]GHC96164.1 membrane protein [Streptomyces finlayi]